MIAKTFRLKLFTLLLILFRMWILIRVHQTDEYVEAVN